MLTAASRVRKPGVEFSMEVTVAGIELRAEDEDQDRGDDHVDQRPGDGDDDLLRRILGDARQAGEAADRQQRDVGRGDAVAPRGDRVAELVQHDAGEHRDDERDAVDRRGGAALRILGEADPGKQDQEGQVDADLAARDPRNGDRPGHGGSAGELTARLAALDVRSAEA